MFTKTNESLETKFLKKESFLMKKILSILLVTVMVLGIANISVMADTEMTFNVLTVDTKPNFLSYKYSAISNGTSAAYSTSNLGVRLYPSKNYPTVSTINVPLDSVVNGGSYNYTVTKAELKLRSSSDVSSAGKMGIYGIDSYLNPLDYDALNSLTPIATYNADTLSKNEYITIDITNHIKNCVEAGKTSADIELAMLMKNESATDDADKYYNAIWTFYATSASSNPSLTITATQSDPYVVKDNLISFNAEDGYWPNGKGTAGSSENGVTSYRLNNVSDGTLTPVQFKFNCKDEGWYLMSARGYNGTTSGSIICTANNTYYNGASVAEFLCNNSSFTDVNVEYIYLTEGENTLEFSVEDISTQARLKSITLDHIDNNMAIIDSASAGKVKIEYMADSSVEYSNDSIGMVSGSGAQLDCYVNVKTAGTYYLISYSLGKYVGTRTYSLSINGGEETEINSYSFAAGSFDEVTDSKARTLMFPCVSTVNLDAGLNKLSMITTGTQTGFTMAELTNYPVDVTVIGDRTIGNLYMQSAIGSYTSLKKTANAYRVFDTVAEAKVAGVSSVNVIANMNKMAVSDTVNGNCFILAPYTAQGNLADSVKVYNSLTMPKTTTSTLETAITFRAVDFGIYSLDIVNNFKVFWLDNLDTITPATACKEIK